MSDVDAAREAFYAAKKAAREARRAFAHGPLSAFVRVMQAAVRSYLEARRQAVSREDAVRGIEGELRAAWPKAVSKFTPACGVCGDTGWEDRTCVAELRCGRSRCARQHPAWEHPYVVPCGCAKGDRYRPRVWQAEDALTAVGKTQPRKKGGSWRQVGS